MYFFIPAGWNVVPARDVAVGDLWPEPLARSAPVKGVRVFENLHT